MSLLPATSHANPETPFWKLAGESSLETGVWQVGGTSGSRTIAANNSGLIVSVDSGTLSSLKPNVMYVIQATVILSTTFSTGTSCPINFDLAYSGESSVYISSTTMSVQANTPYVTLTLFFTPDDPTAELAIRATNQSSTVDATLTFNVTNAVIQQVGAIPAQNAFMNP